jgi:hypothetical protein
VYTSKSSVGSSVEFYLFADSITDNVGMNEPRSAELAGDPDDYRVGDCSGTGCCSSPAYDAFSLSRHAIVPDERYELFLSGGEKYSFWQEGSLTVGGRWRINGMAGTFGRIREGARLTLDGRRLSWRGGLSYGGCFCSDCGRHRLSIHTEKWPCDVSLPVIYSATDAEGLAAAMTADGLEAVPSAPYWHRLEITGGGSSSTRSELRLCSPVAPREGWARAVTGQDGSVSLGVEAEPQVLTAVGYDVANVAEAVAATRLALALDSTDDALLDTTLVLWLGSDEPLTELGLDPLDETLDDLGAISLDAWRTAPLVLRQGFERGIEPWYVNDIRTGSHQLVSDPVRSGAQALQAGPSTCASGCSGTNEQAVDLKASFGGLAAARLEYWLYEGGTNDAATGESIRLWVNQVEVDNPCPIDNEGEWVHCSHPLGDDVQEVRFYLRDLTDAGNLVIDDIDVVIED